MSKRCVLSVAFVILGGYCFVLTVVMFFEFGRMIATFLEPGYFSTQSPWPRVIGLGGEFIALGLVAFALIFRADRLARWIVREDETVVVRVPPGWEDAALRVGFAIAAVLLFVQSLNEFMVFFFHIGLRTGPLGNGRYYVVRDQWSAFVRALIRLAASVYLFLGAPRFREYILGRIGPKPPVNDLPPTEQANRATKGE